MLVHGGGHVREETDRVLLGLLALGVSHGTTEDVLVLHLGEVDAILSVRVRVLFGVVPVIEPSGVGTQVLGMAGSPVLDGQVADRAALVVAADGHAALVSLVVDGFGAQVPLSLLAETLQDVVGAHLHDAELLVHAGGTALFSGAALVLPDLTVATAGNERGLQGHELRLLHVGVHMGTVLVTESLALAIGVPLISVGALVVPVVLVERVVQVTIHPRQLGDVSEVERHLGQLTVGLVVVVLPKGIQLLVDVAVHDLVAKVPVRLHDTLVLDPLSRGGMIEIVHF